MESIDDKLGTKKEMNLGRIGINTLWSGVLGYTFYPSTYMAPIGAAIGFGLTLYDEAKQKGMDLNKPFFGAAVGGIIGCLLGTSGTAVDPAILSNVGGAVGGVLGLYADLSKPKCVEQNDKDIYGA